MIYCVRFTDIESHLSGLGFRRVAATEQNVLFMSASALVTIRAPNVNGDIPEVLVNEAYDNAGLTVPRWDVFFCD